MPWFETWFDSPYYHILYQHRNERDAELFLDHLLEYLDPAPLASMLDLGCGRGRHSIYLNEKGYSVTGIDLSFQSIEHCTKFENENLSFFVHDMRKLFRVNDFDYVFNLFTSFGYFEKDSENQDAIKNACFSLKNEGTLVIDYLNTAYLQKHIIPEAIVTVDDINFEIKRSFIDGFFFKEIRFTADGKDHHFTEKVSGLTLADFERYMLPYGMKIIKLAGNYNLDTFDESTSPRLIIIAIKEN